MQLVVQTSADEATARSAVEAGAVPLLAEMLDSKRVAEDKVHAATVALVFLSSSDVSCCTQLGDHPTAVDHLLQVLAEKRARRGFRSAASTILVNVACEHTKAADLFVMRLGPELILRALWDG